MPLTQQQTLSIAPAYRWGLWHITESEAQLLEMCTEGERSYAARFGTPERRREWLAWHALLHQMAPHAEAYYRDNGVPALQEGYIGVSHTRGYAAIIIGEEPCGIDIERRDRNFSRAVYRILTDEEREGATTLPDGAGIYWCAKEALYKWGGHAESDYQRDIRIDTIDPFLDTFTGSVVDRRATLYDLSTSDLIVVGCRG